MKPLATISINNALLTAQKIKRFHPIDSTIYNIANNFTSAWNTIWEEHGGNGIDGQIDLLELAADQFITDLLNAIARNEG